MNGNDKANLNTVNVVALAIVCLLIGAVVWLFSENADYKWKITVLNAEIVQLSEKITTLESNVVNQLTRRVTDIDNTLVKQSMEIRVLREFGILQRALNPEETPIGDD